MKSGPAEHRTASYKGLADEGDAFSQTRLFSIFVARMRSHPDYHRWGSPPVSDPKPIAVNKGKSGADRNKFSRKTGKAAIPDLVRP